MGNDFLDQLNYNYQLKEEKDKEKRIRQQKLDEENKIKTQQAKIDATKEYNILIESFIDTFKNGAVAAVSDGNFVEMNNKKMLKGSIELCEYKNIYYDMDDSYDLSLRYKFYKPVEKSRFLLGKQITWDENPPAWNTGGISLYENMPPITNDHSSPYNKIFRQKCDLIHQDKDFLFAIKNSVPTIKFDKKWEHVAVGKKKLEFSFMF